VLSRFKKIAVMASGATAILLTATACAGGASSSSTPSAAATSSSGAANAGAITKPVTITFDEVYDAGAQKTAMQAAAAAFEKANPLITVKLVTYTGYGPLLTAETAQVAAGDPPTMGQAYESWAQKFAASNVIVPINQLPGAAGTEPADLATFYTGVQNDLKLPDGKTWMWPFDKSLQVLFYNANLLKADGITTAPTTWAQFATDLKTASKGGVTGITIDTGSATEGTTSGELWLEELAASNGTPVYKSDGTPQFTSPAAVSALQYLVNLKKEGALATGTNFPGETALGAKKGLVDLSSSAGYSFEVSSDGGKFPLTTTGLPAGGSGGVDEMAGANLVVFAKAATDQQAAAWKFLQFLSSAPEQAAWSSATGYYPITSQALTDPAMASYLAKNPWVKATINGLNTATVDPAYSWVTQCGIDLSTALSAALTGTSPTAALSTAQSACTTAKSNA
jgi:multiple sugar transport system substrate-binding protein